MRLLESICFSALCSLAALVAFPSTAFALICQEPDLQRHPPDGAFAQPSDRNEWVLVVRADDLTVSPGEQVLGVRWWGIHEDFSSSDPCGPVDNFTITFFDDDSGLPGVAVVVYPLGGAADRTDTGARLDIGQGGRAVYQYEITLDPPFDPAPSSEELFWIEIANDTTGSTCEWLWLTAPGNGLSALDLGGGYVDVAFDLAVCLNPEGPFDFDCDDNGIVDVCDLDCGALGGACAVPGCGEGVDCQPNGLLDLCEIAEDPTLDCNFNDIPDECDIAQGTSPDDNADGVPDECGACCRQMGLCTQRIGTACQPPADYHGDGTHCDNVQCTAVPAVSEWGVLLATLLILTTGTLAWMRRRTALV